MITETEKCFILLLKAALNREEVELPREVDFELLIELAARHHVLGVLAAPLQKLKSADDRLYRAAWQEQMESIRMDTLQRFELGAIETAMEQAQIPVMPLKGAIMKQLYPYTYMRTMTDLDILYRKEDEQRIIDTMQRMSYECEGKEEDNHLIFFKPPLTHIEFHSSLLPSECQYRFRDGDWEHTALVEGKSYVYRMNWTRYYEYLFLHLIQHFFAGGVGARFIMDIYVFNSRCAELIDRSPFEQDCVQLGILDFVKNMERLALVWFEKGTMDDTQQELSEFILEGGLYGSVEHREASSLNRAGGKKLKYFLKELFEPASYLRSIYPSLNKLSFLLPFYYVHRIPTRIIKSRGRAIRRLQAGKGLTKEQAKRQANLFKKVGI